MIQHDEVGLSREPGGDVLPGSVCDRAGRVSLVLVDQVRAELDIDRVRAAVRLVGAHERACAWRPFFPAALTDDLASTGVGLEVVNMASGFEKRHVVVEDRSRVGVRPQVDRSDVQDAAALAEDPESPTVTATENGVIRKRGIIQEDPVVVDLAPVGVQVDVDRDFRPFVYQIGGSNPFTPVVSQVTMNQTVIIEHDLNRPVVGTTMVVGVLDQEVLWSGARHVDIRMYIQAV